MPGCTYGGATCISIHAPLEFPKHLPQRVSSRKPREPAFITGARATASQPIEPERSEGWHMAATHAERKRLHVEGQAASTNLKGSSIVLT